MAQIPSRHPALSTASCCPPTRPRPAGTPGDIGRADLMALAQGWGLPPRAAGKVLDETVARVDRWVHLLGESGFPERTVSKWRRAVE